MNNPDLGFTPPRPTARTDEGDHVRAGNLVFNQKENWWGTIVTDPDPDGWFYIQKWRSYLTLGCHVSWITAAGPPIPENYGEQAGSPYTG